MRLSNFLRKWFYIPTKLFSSREYFIIFWNTFLLRRYILLLSNFFISIIIALSLCLVVFLNNNGDNIKFILNCTLISTSTLIYLLSVVFFLIIVRKNIYEKSSLIILITNYSLSFTSFILSVIFILINIEVLTNWNIVFQVFISIFGLIIPLLSILFLFNPLLFLIKSFLNKKVKSSDINISYISKDDFSRKWEVIKDVNEYWGKDENLSGDIKFIGIYKEVYSKRGDTKFCFSHLDKIILISFSDLHFINIFNKDKRAIDKLIAKQII